MLQEAQAYKRASDLAVRKVKWLVLTSYYHSIKQLQKSRVSVFFLETLERIYSNNAKVFVDVEGGNNLLYLPLDKLMENQLVAIISVYLYYQTIQVVSRMVVTQIPAQLRVVEVSRDTTRFL